MREPVRRGLRRGAHTCVVLFRVTIPTFVVIDLLSRLGVVAAVGAACAPAMALFRLPGEAAIPVLLGYLVNLYTATAALGSLGLSGSQITTLGLMLGLAHTLVVETVVLRAAGTRWGRLLAYRLAASVLVGLVVSRFVRVHPAPGAALASAAAQAAPMPGELGRAALASAAAGAWFSLKLAAILVPALILYEVLAPLPIFGRWGRRLGPRLGRLGMSPPCTVPLAAGFFLGLTYGAGIIIPIAEEGRIDRFELQSVGLFLVNCHAVVEDTLLFALIGAHGPLEVVSRMALLAGARLALAVAVTSGHASWRARAARAAEAA